MKYGNTKIPFGDNIGKTFDEVSLDDLDGIVMWLVKKGMDKSWKFGEFYEKAVEYLEANGHGPSMDHGGGEDIID